MKIDILTFPGSTTGIVPEDIETPGVGGSELMLLRWAEHMTLRGHTITIYNDPRIPGVHEGVCFKHSRDFKNEEWRDVLISFRSPQAEETIPARAGVRIGWSTDQFDVNYQRQWYALVDGMVGISEYHRRDHLARCGLTDAASKMRVIEIGSMPSEYPSRAKTPYQFLYNSIPGRGLIHLAEMWPMLRARFPEASLVITSDFGLWTQGRYAGNDEYREMFRGAPGVRFLGRIPRSELIRHELASEIHLYPCIYEELFCISSAEAQMAGCYSITTSKAALKTTNFTGFQTDLDPATREGKEALLAEVVRFYSFPQETRAALHAEIRHRAHARFDWNRICTEWEAYISELQKAVHRH